jgi:hypothetical protein
MRLHKTHGNKGTNLHIISPIPIPQYTTWKPQHIPSIPKTQEDPQFVTQFINPITIEPQTYKQLTHLGHGESRQRRPHKHTQYQGQLHHKHCTALYYLIEQHLKNDLFRAK